MEKVSESQSPSLNPSATPTAPLINSSLSPVLRLGIKSTCCLQLSLFHRTFEVSSAHIIFKNVSSFLFLHCLFSPLLPSDLSPPFFSDISLPSRYFLLNSLKHLVCLFGFHYLIIGFSFILILHSPQFPSLPAQAVIFQCEPSKSALAWIFWRNVSVHFRIHMWSVLNPGRFRCFLQLMLMVTLL